MACRCPSRAISIGSRSPARSPPARTAQVGALTSLSGWLRALTLVTARGERRTLTVADGVAFEAAQLSLGTLGAVVSATLELEPAYYLSERTWSCSVVECERDLATLIDGNRHFEFFWTPRDDRCAMKTLNPVARAPHATAAAPGERVAPAYRIFPSERDIRFNEMEYAVPFAQGWDCFMELRTLLRRDFPKLPWPIEFRTLAADRALLSPACERDSVTLSVHQGAERDYRPLFRAAEAVFGRYRGRPHWGKLHGLESVGLAELYPRFGEFQAVRRGFDPDGRFLNDYLARLFEP